MATTVNYDAAASHLGSKEASKSKGGTKVKPMKEFHVKELHDGTYHVMMHHGRDHMGMETKPPTEGSAHDLDGVHDHLEDHMGSPNDGEGEHEERGEHESEHEHEHEHGGEKKQGHESKPKHEHESLKDEEREEAEEGETVEK